VQCQRKNKIFNALLKVCCLWLVLGPATAQVYKWVDENGGTHYGQRPPPGAKAKGVEERLANPGPAAGKSKPTDWQDKELELRGRRAQAEQNEAKKQQEEVAKRKACNQARDDLARTKSAGRVYKLDDKGERVFQTDAERNASTARQEQLIATHCR
jgi:hypothetical protein